MAKKQEVDIQHTFEIVAGLSDGLKHHLRVKLHVLQFTHQEQCLGKPCPKESLKGKFFLLARASKIDGRFMFSQKDKSEKM